MADGVPRRGASAVGDHVVYEIASLSVLVIRTAPDKIRAYHNVCLHRGRLLKDRDGSCAELRCPFHGFTWSLDGELVSLPSAREFLAAATRETMRGTHGADVETLCDAELVDSFYYTVFPNFHPWGAFNRIVYRFRPNGDDPDSSIMEVMFLAPYREGEKPPPAKVHWLGVDEVWTGAAELGFLARIFNQDSFNLPQVQRGLHALQKPGVTLAMQQEAKIRHFHLLLEKWLYA